MKLNTIGYTIVHMSNQSYVKNCRDCNQQIRMDQVNGKWASYNLDGTSFHKCRNKNGGGQVLQQQTRPLTLEQLDARLKRVEKMMDAFIMAGVTSDGSP